MFSIVGTAGFLVDASALYLLVHGLGWNPYLGRAASYLLAATTTWVLNRRFTFTSEFALAPHKQWAFYVLANAVGGGVNFAVYSALVTWVDGSTQYLLTWVAAGSIAGLLVNFTPSKYWVFRETDR